MDIFKYNSEAWDAEAAKGNTWTKPVSPEEVKKARNGELRLLLTPTKPVPPAWLGEVRGKDILCLASGGGQQGPLLAAAGACVTVLDASREQLARDRQVAEREGLKLSVHSGDMRDLSRFADGSFDLVLNPISNCFIPEVAPVWKECFRVLRSGGSLLCGFNNPVVYSFDRELLERGVLQVKYPIPYSDLTSLTETERQEFIGRGEPLEFGHSLGDQIGGQIAAGFLLSGFYEDIWGNGKTEDRYFPQFIATRALKPQ